MPEQGVTRPLSRRWLPLFAALLATTATATSPTAPQGTATLATLDCRRVSAAEVDAVLAAAPAPRVIALEGSVPIVTMEPLAAFLESMGYPAERLANPADGKRSYGSFVASRRVAGELAWHYEREGLMPMLIGHSRGGMVVIRTLNDLAGVGGEPIPVWNPGRDEPEARTTIVDPFTGQSRPVVGLRVDYAVAMVTGSLPRRLLGQWGVVPLLQEVPDSVVEFTGFAIPWDPVAGTGPNPTPFRAAGLARVRNIVLPASYSHIGLPRTDHLAREPATRAWIDAYFPGTTAPPPAGVDTTNLLHAADIWYSVKQHWCGGAKRLLARGRGRRAALRPDEAAGDSGSRRIRGASGRPKMKGAARGCERPVPRIDVRRAERPCRDRYIRSRIVAMPCPPPMRLVHSAQRPPVHPSPPP